MKYLIFDTNIWIFLANSQNTKDGKYHEDIHFRLLSRLKELVQEDKIQILTNDIIKDEWNRNKIRTQEGIKKLTDKRNTNLNIIKEVRASLEEADQQLLDIISKKYQDQIEKQIERNRAHIEEVEDFFLRFTTKIPVSDAVKLKCTEIALAKKAPFKGDKSNSMADALILLSAIDYIKELELSIPGFDKIRSFPESSFVSHNENDFCAANKKDIHEDLAPLLEEVQMEFISNFWKNVNEIVEKELFELEERRKAEEEYWENVYMCTECPPENSHSCNFVHFDEPEEITIEGSEPHFDDPNQLVIPFNTDYEYKTQTSSKEQYK